MTKMSKAQRNAVLDAHGREGQYRGMVVARHSTWTILRREGWVLPVQGVTRAGLIAAGVDMDAMYVDAVLENEHRAREAASAARSHTECASAFADLERAREMVAALHRHA